MLLSSKPTSALMEGSGTFSSAVGGWGMLTGSRGGGFGGDGLCSTLCRFTGECEPRGLGGDARLMVSGGDTGAAGVHDSVLGQPSPNKPD